jgi:DNA-directed RNA polymerase specialized sigma24 family protein
VGSLSKWLWPLEHEDIEQERAIARLEAERNGKSAATAVFYCMSHIYKKASRMRSHAGGYGISEDHPSGQDVFGAVADREVLRSIDRLPARYRPVIRGQLAGFNNTEIAQLTGLAKASVDKYAGEAKVLLRGMM